MVRDQFTWQKFNKFIKFKTYYKKSGNVKKFKFILIGVGQFQLILLASL